MLAQCVCVRVCVCVYVCVCSVVPARAQGLGSAALDLPDLAGVPQTRW